MESDRAREIIRSLADGRDPATGEQFPPNSPYQQADTVRALYLALEALNSASSAALREKSPRPKDPNRPKMGSSWSPEEEQQLREEFAARKSFSDIAAAHGRATGAITARLVRLGLIEETVVTRAGRGHAPDAGRPRPSAAQTDTNRSAPTATPPPAELSQEQKDSLPF